MALRVAVAVLALLSCRGQPGAATDIEATSGGADAAQPSSWDEQRELMVEGQIRRRGVKNEDVLRAMAVVPRHLFVPQDLVGEAYADHPLPIGYGQTISQPYMVAAMTELLALRASDRVLEIGTGSGYQAAILAELVSAIYTIEIVPELCDQARSRLAGMGHENIHVRCGDGYYGWPEEAPFQAIIVTAAPDHIPQPLVAQLADGGRMVLPVGPPGSHQVLWLVERQGAQVTSRQVMDVLFVPLTGDHDKPSPTR